jgi:hypothetical protein
MQTHQRSVQTHRSPTKRIPPRSNLPPAPLSPPVPSLRTARQTKNRLGGPAPDSSAIESWLKRKATTQTRGVARPVRPNILRKRCAEQLQGRRNFRWACVQDWPHGNCPIDAAGSFALPNIQHHIIPPMHQINARTFRQLLEELTGPTVPPTAADQAKPFLRGVTSPTCQTFAAYVKGTVPGILCEWLHLTASGRFY